MARLRQNSLFIIYSKSSAVWDDNKSKTLSATIHPTTQNGRLYNVSRCPAHQSFFRLFGSLSRRLWLSGSFFNSLVSLISFPVSLGLGHHSTSDRRIFRRKYAAVIISNRFRIALAFLSPHSRIA